MSDVAKAREAVAEAVRDIACDSYNHGEDEATAYERGYPTSTRETVKRRDDILASAELFSALDALILAVRRDERERLASAVELSATDPRSPTALCGWAKEPPGLAAWLRKEVP